MTEKSSPQPVAPFGYYYKSLGGRGILHVVGEASDSLIAADMAAARDYPTGHKCIPLFERTPSPAVGPRVPLTPKEVHELYLVLSAKVAAIGSPAEMFADIVRDVEAAHGIGSKPPVQDQS